MMLDVKKVNMMEDGTAKQKNYQIYGYMGSKCHTTYCDLHTRYTGVLTSHNE